MGVLFMDGADHYGAGAASVHYLDVARKWSSNQYTARVQMGSPGEGGVGQSLKELSTGLIWKSIPEATTVVVGFYYKLTAHSTGMILLYLYNGGQIALQLTMTTSGQLTLTPQSGAGTTSTETLPLDTWVHIEVKSTCNATTGTAELRVDGVEWINETGLDTYYSGNAAYDQVAISHTNGFDNEYDHIYVLDAGGSAPNDFLGPVKIATIYPDGDATPNNFTATGAGTTNADRVSETILDSDTTYVSSSTVGNKDLYTLDALPAGIDTIHSAQVVTAWKKDGTGTRTVRSYVDSNATISNGATVGLNESYSFGTQVLDTDPDTATAWTVSGINALKSGIEIVS